MKRQALLTILIALTLIFTACSKNNDSPTLEVEGHKQSATKNNDKKGNDKTNQKTTQAKDSTTKKPVTTQAKIGTTSVAKDGSIKISWASVSGAISYDVYRATTSDGEYSKVGNTTATSYTDTSAQSGKTYYYKIVAVSPAPNTSNSPTTPADKGPKFVGSTISFTGDDKKSITLSSLNEDKYIAKIKSDFAQAGQTMPNGRLVSKSVAGSNFRYVYQFMSSNTWDNTTLEMVYVFENSLDFQSFFVNDKGSEEYLAAKAQAEKDWNADKNNMPYEKQRQLFLTEVTDPHFKTLHDQSFR